MTVLIRTECDDIIDKSVYKMTPKKYQETLDSYQDLLDRGIIDLRVYEVRRNVKVIEVYY